MDIEAVRSALEQAGPASLAIGFTIGLFFSFNPLTFAVIPCFFFVPGLAT